MENAPDAEEAKKAKRKQAHRASMLGTGFWMVGCGLAAAYLAFGGGGDLPALLYGHWRRAEVGTQSAPVEPGAVLAVYAKEDPQQLPSVLSYIEHNLGAPDGGYYLKAAAPGVEGDHRILAGQNAGIVTAVFDSRAALAGAGQAFALKTLDLWWTAGIKDGRVRRELGSPEPAGALDDELAMAEAYGAAFQATGDRKQADRAAALLEWAERRYGGSGRDRAENVRRRLPAGR